MAVVIITSRSGTEGQVKYKIFIQDAPIHVQGETKVNREFF